MNAVLSLVSLVGSGALCGLSANFEAFRSAARFGAPAFFLLADAEIAKVYVEVLTRDHFDSPTVC